MDEKLIKKELNLTIQDNEATLDEPLHLYRHDKNIDIFITISNLKFDFITGMPQTEDVIYSANAQYFSIRIVKPNGKKISTSLMPTINNRVGFSIEKEFMDELDEVGVYQLQISLHADIDGESRITIPPIEFEVHSHIYGEDEEINGDYGESIYFAKVIDENADVNSEEIKTSTIDETKIIRSNLVYEQYKNRREQKLGTGLYLWQAGDYIDNARMNAIHNFILDLDVDVEQLQNDTKDIPSDIANIQTDITNMQTDITNIRNNLNKNIEAKDIMYISYSDFTNVEQALDYLLYKPIAITSFTCNAISTIREYGSYLSNITFNWEYNKNIESHSFYGETLSNSRLREYLYKPAFNSDRTFTLVASDGKTTAQRSISFHFYKRMYWGTTRFLTSNSSIAVLINELQNSELRNSHKDSITVNAGEEQYIYYIVPVEFADCEFSVNGFIGGISLVATNVTYTNVYDKEVIYNIYRSDNHSLGNTTIKIL